MSCILRFSVSDFEPLKLLLKACRVRALDHNFCRARITIVLWLSDAYLLQSSHCISFSSSHSQSCYLKIITGQWLIILPCGNHGGSEVTKKVTESDCPS